MGSADPGQFTYLHVTPGRLRVQSLVMKRDAARARRAEADLAAVPGITLARVSDLTGSILLHFDAAQWTPGGLLALLRKRGYLGAEPVRSAAAVAAQRERDALAECCALIGKELLAAAIGRMFPHPIVTTLLAVV